MLRNARVPASLILIGLAVSPACGQPAALVVAGTPEEVLFPRTKDEADAAAKVELTKVTHKEMLERIAANKGAKYTLVDAWATWCAPCKENFPHVVEMHEKYGKQGLAVCSLSLDDPTDAKATGEALAFLKQQKAVFTNFLMNEEADAAFEKLNINVVPAVFIFGPDGKEVKRFTLDDSDNQFTYEQVEAEVKALLAKGK